MQFTHPLARGAKVWTAITREEARENLLLIVTTLELDSTSKRYKADKVERLKQAAQEWLVGHPAEAAGYVLISRLKEWH